MECLKDLESGKSLLQYNGFQNEIYVFPKKNFNEKRFFTKTGTNQVHMRPFELREKHFFYCKDLESGKSFHDYNGFLNENKNNFISMYANGDTLCMYKK